MVAFNGSNIIITSGLFGCAVMLMLIVYYKISTEILYFNYLITLKLSDKNFKSLFFYHYKYKMMSILLGMFGFLIYIPRIKMYLIDNIRYKLDIKLLFYYKEARFHNMEGHFDNEIKLLERKLTIRKLIK